jgi:uncharacterized membrane protein YoaK (UPF0700 family)
VTSPLPLVFEAVLLICFGFIGSHLGQREWLFVPATVMLLCFIMGLQNAIITKLSGARIRTTHVTGGDRHGHRTWQTLLLERGKARS